MNEECKVCGTKYEARVSRVQSDSHFTYTEYKPCPNCNYTAKIEDDIRETLKEKTKLRFNPGNPITMNTEELTDLILAHIAESWPKSKGK